VEGPSLKLVGENGYVLEAIENLEESDVHPLPWQDGLPEVIESSLQPYRDLLDNSYGAMGNALEIGVARRQAQRCDSGPSCHLENVRREGGSQETEAARSDSRRAAPVATRPTIAR
jgi:hypothetical protein